MGVSGEVLLWVRGSDNVCIALEQKNGPIRRQAFGPFFFWLMVHNGHLSALFVVKFWERRTHTRVDGWLAAIRPPPPGPGCCLY